MNLKKLKQYLVHDLLNGMDNPSDSHLSPIEKVGRHLRSVIESQGIPLTEDQERLLINDVIADVFGFGPIQTLLENPEISEIMVSGPNKIYIEKRGILEDTNLLFQDEKHLYRIIDRMLHPVGRRVDADNPTADARLPDGSRLNVVIPPVAIDGPTITIRKFLRSKFSMEQIINLETITKNMALFLEACVVARLNILITGNTSSGKTTLLNILSGFIPGNERIITIEDAAELQLNQKYIVRLETQSAGMDGEGEITTRDLVRNSLRMRPDRLVVGEVRSGEALDMLQAMNTGHDGSLTTLHANSPRDAISRIETMSMMAGLDMPLMAIRKQIASAIDLIVHMERLVDGTRKVTRIAEVPRMEGDVVTLSDIFRFDQTGSDAEGNITGEMKATGIRPLFSKKLEIVGYKLSGEIYGAK